MSYISYTYQQHFMPLSIKRHLSAATFIEPGIMRCCDPSSGTQFPNKSSVLLPVVHPAKTAEEKALSVKGRTFGGINSIIVVTNLKKQTTQLMKVDTTGGICILPAEFVFKKKCVLLQHT
uniref:Uncharacterized protein n=1 Tax=Onchocerca volvulus TaxID=6282 RepID=A0A8R1XUP1_ONCVO